MKSIYLKRTPHLGKTASLQTYLKTFVWGTEEQRLRAEETGVYWTALVDFDRSKEYAAPTVEELFLSFQLTTNKETVMRTLRSVNLLGENARSLILETHED